MSTCEFDARHHSDDIAIVYSGATEPHALCGYHATYYLDLFYARTAILTATVATETPGSTEVGP